MALLCEKMHEPCNQASGTPGGRARLSVSRENRYVAGFNTDCKHGLKTVSGKGRRNVSIRVSESRSRQC